MGANTLSTTFGLHDNKTWAINCLIQLQIIWPALRALGIAYFYDAFSIVPTRNVAQATEEVFDLTSGTVGDTLEFDADIG